jgi:hypothetical protein
MTAGLARPIDRAKVSLAPAALVGLLGAALLTGGMLGVGITSELGSLGPSRAVAPASSTERAIDHIKLTESLIPLRTTRAANHGK